MKLTNRNIPAYMRQPSDGHVAVLVYGPDSGLVRERSEALAKLIVPDLSDPFRVAEFSGDALGDDPQRLADEAAALSFTGGRRVIRLRRAGDKPPALVKALKAFLSAPEGDAFIVIDAGDLSGRSGLRKLFEGAKNAAALPCYADDPDMVADLIEASCQKEGWRIEPDAKAFMVDHLGNDRQVTRNEIEKLLLYKGKPSADDQVVTLDDVRECAGDNAAESLDDVIQAVGLGNLDGMDHALNQAIAAGNDPIMILRSMQRHFLRLHLAAGYMAQGRSPDDAMKALRPPVFFKAVPGFRRQLQQWPVPTLNRALNILTQAEIQVKSSGIPVEAIVRRDLMRLAMAARRR